MRVQHSDVEREALSPDLGAIATPTRGHPVARNKNIHLRTLTPEDMDDIAVWAEDPFIERMVGSELLHAYVHVYEQDAARFYEACLTDTRQVIFLVVPNGGVRTVGLVRLFNIHMEEGYAFFETIIVDKGALRRGFGVQATRLISYYGMDVLGLRRIEAKVYAYNVVSMNALRRNGCIQEGVLRKAAYQDGQYWDVVIFGILREELDEVRKQDRYLVNGEWRPE